MGLVVGGVWCTFSKGGVWDSLCEAIRIDG